MVVVTADRPPELHGVGAPQTIDQIDLYGRAVRLFRDPGVAEDTTGDTWRPLASDVWWHAAGKSPGPVQLNLPFREPLVGVVRELPASDALPPPSSFDLSADEVDAVAELLDERRGLIVAGDGVDDPAAVQSLAAATGWPVLADPMSGCQMLDVAVVRFDAVLRHAAFAAEHRPLVVVQLGLPPASKVLAQWLAGSGAEHVAVSPVGLTSDPNLVGARQVHAPIGALCTALATQLSGVDGDWQRAWLAADHVCRSAIDDFLAMESNLSEPGAARAVTANIPSGGHLVVASSMPVRDVEWFGTPRSDVTIHANRGANGIDGVIATAIGVAVASGAPTAVYLGDIAFCHDLSSLTALKSRGLDLTIVVTDNDGGGIFSFLPQASALAPSQFESLFGTPHGTDIVEVARAFGLRAYSAKTAQHLAEAFDEPDTSVVRVVSDRTENVAAHAAINAAAVAAMG
jgi:2-succinyl-5-enolpyruvyl-6-hydroxy-3-cyclohexene-1-carboxylate synthase